LEDRIGRSLVRPDHDRRAPGFSQVPMVERCAAQHDTRCGKAECRGVFAMPLLDRAEDVKLGAWLDVARMAECLEDVLEALTGCDASAHEKARRLAPWCRGHR